MYAQRISSPRRAPWGARSADHLARSCPTSFLALSYALTIGIIIVAESALSFLGQGLNATTASWGTLIVQGKNDLQTAPWVALSPATIMFITVLALNHVGERFRSRFDVREAAV